ncbi:SGNH/GDSL hydrolase family protein [Wenyingzhuangia sp. IMCC45467]
MRKFNLLYIFFLCCVLACGKPAVSEIIQENSIELEVIDPEVVLESDYKILSLGDSYTIGESVCSTCNYPEQLKQKLISNFTKVENINLKIVARTGWKTSSLLSALALQEVDEDYDFVTLLIGVNNQYQGVSFHVYEKEFPELVSKSIVYANGNKNHVVVLSIPDYAYTPFGGENISISEEIAEYNSFAKRYCETNGITFLNITDITMQGLNNPNLVANDGLHPSALAYAKFVKRLLPLFVEKMMN